MERYLNLMFIRFGLIAGALVVLALVVFAIALALKRRGRLDQARRYAEPAVRAAVRAAARRLEDGPSGARRRDGRR
ncbi:hypothetical protein DY245_09950 [Streptomyces inhibens]|uniref:Uncharacterized protein n=2 Tax=Streptomyces inhibens TaxID=2293571 RepID=A0A371Q729_STRIH|nr:hypothetical protein DY245_09950 [Streptomyces inhibens]